MVPSGTASMVPVNLKTAKKEKLNSNIVANVNQDIISKRMIMVIIFAWDMMEAMILLLILLQEIKLNMLC